MKKFILLTFFCATIAFLISCGEEKFFDHTEISHYVLAASKEEPFIVSLINLPENEIEIADIISKFNRLQLTKPVENILVFRDEIFLFIPENFQILILDVEAYTIKSSVDFSSTNEKPISACFPNATDCYIIHRDGNSVSLLDLTNYQIARKISVGKGTSSISVAGNQIFVTNKIDNTVSIVDSRTHEEEAVVPVPKKPAFVDISADNKKAAVVCLGDGKEGGTEAKSEAMLAIIDIESRAVSDEQAIGLGIYKADEQIPRFFAVSNVGFGFISTQQALFRADIRRDGKISLAERGDFSKLLFDFKTEEILMWKHIDSKLYLRYSSPSTGAEHSSYRFDSKYSVFFPLK